MEKGDLSGNPTSVGVDSKDRKTILVMTGGGLAQCLNATIYGVVKAAKDNNLKVLGGVGGYASLLPWGEIVDITDIDFEDIRYRGGSFLKTSRTNPLKFKDGLENVSDTLLNNRVDYLVTIGGDDTMGVARKLSERGFNVVGIPKSIDNDLSATYWTPGFITATRKLISLIGDLRDREDMEKNVEVVEVLGGQDAGWVAAATVYGGADIIIPPEREYELTDVLKKVKERSEIKNPVILVMSESSRIKGMVSGEDNHDTSFSIKRQRYGSLWLSERINEALGYKTRVVMPGHYLMCGKPDRFEADLSSDLGKKAVSLLIEGKSGVLAGFSYEDGKISIRDFPLSEVVGSVKGEKVKVLDDKMFDFKNMYPREGFFRYMEPLLGKEDQPPRVDSRPNIDHYGKSIRG